VVPYKSSAISLRWYGLCTAQACMARQVGGTARSVRLVHGGAELEALRWQA
jgi:hypothetical protein